MSSADLLLERAPDKYRRPPVGPKVDRFESEANAVAERLAWRMPASAESSGRDGTPLPEDVRTNLEGELPYDLSSIRLHAGSRGDAAARGLGAHAVTLGTDIAFARGAYDPGTTAGRRTLAHEIVHAAQQGGAPAVTRAGASLGRSPAGVAQRTPGVDAADSWKELVTLHVSSDKSSRATRANEAGARFLKLPEGARLVNRLWHLANDKAKKAKFTITISFVDEIPPTEEGIPAGSDTAGRFEPEDADARAYRVFVKNVAPWHGSPPLFSETASKITFSHYDAESAMAETIHHELLHVEFVRAGLSDLYPTGHGSKPETQTDPLFLKREVAFIRDLDALEKEIHAKAQAEAEEKQRQAEEKRRKEEEGRRPPPVAKPPESGPSFVGGQVLAEGGALGLGAPRGTAIVGADLLLGRIDALHVGVRGVYLSPTHLLAGGTVGYRLLEGESRPGQPVENPLFFDLEAGLLIELTPTQGDRLTQHVAGIGGAAIGQEFGTSGTRFFWKLGGFVIVTDQNQWGGGATAGIGVRF